MSSSGLLISYILKLFVVCLNKLTVIYQAIKQISDIEELLKKPIKLKVAHCSLLNFQDLSILMKLSIVLCTYNNAESLRLTLNDIASCVLDDAAQIEVIVVNNNATDHTQQVYEDVKGLFSCPVHHTVESNQGLSHARNLGLSAATGEYVLFTDDDAIIPTTWIQAYLQHIERSSPACLYSKIRVHWEKTIPDWYIPEYQAFFVHLNYGDEKQNIIDIHHEFFGKNFCVRRDILNEYGGFDPKLGRSGDKLIAGEETLIYLRLIAENRKVLYFPEAEVGHRLKEREYTLENIKKLFSDSSYSAYHIPKMTSGKKLFGRPLYPLKSNLLGIPGNLVHLFKNFFWGNENRARYFRFRLSRNFKVLGLWWTNP
jgi:glycosyltransferase involved in cell wall biosynthesis